MKYKLIAFVFVLLLALQLGSAAVYRGDPNLFATYQFEQTSGNALDSHTYGRNATSTTVGYNFDGKYQKAFNFSGSSDGVTLPFNSNGLQSNSFTFSTWFNITTTSVQQYILGTTTGAFAVSVSPRSTGVFLARGTADTNTGYIPTTNVWNHYVLTFNGTTYQQYVNGVLNFTIDGTLVNDANWNIGRHASLTGYQFRGRMDEFYVWNRTLTSSDVSELYRAGAGLFYPFEGVSFVNLTKPANNTGFSAITTQTFNATASIDTPYTATNATRYLWNSTGSLISTNFSNTITAGNKTNFSIPNLPSGSYRWNIQMCSSFGDCEFAPANFTFSVDSVSPIINITYPRNYVNYYRVGSNLSLNITFTETNPNVCSLNYKSQGNMSFTCASNSTFNATDYYNRSIIVYMTDTAGNLGYNISNWEYYVYQYNPTTISSTVSAGATQNLYLNISSTSLKTISAAYLVYNGTSYLATTNDLGSQNYSFYRELETPTAGTTQIKNVYWSIQFTDGIIVNTTTETQTVLPIQLMMCGGASNTTAINFTIRDEITSTRLNSSLSLSYIYGNANGSASNTLNFTYGNSADNQTNYALCVFPSDAYLFVTGTTSYSKSGYGLRSYYFNDATISNATQNITLYLLSSGNSTTFTFTVVDLSGNAVSNAYVYVQRWDVGTNTYNTVSVLQTNGEGQASTGLQLNDAWYRYQVTYNDVLYLTTSPQVETSNSRTLKIGIGQDNPYYNFYSMDGDVAFNNNTNTFTFTFVDTTGSAQRACLVVNQVNSSNDMVISESCIYGSSGTTFYQVQNNGTYVAKGIATLVASLGSYEGILDTESVTIGKSNAALTVGEYGQIITAILVITGAALGAAVNSLILGVGLVIGGLFFSTFMGWLAFSGTNVFIGLVIIGIMLGLIAYRRYF